jgi:hypothetical protein
MTIMALKPNQLQVTTISIHKQMQSLSEYTKFYTINHMLRSFDLENNHENLEEQEDNPFDISFNQLHGNQAIRNTYHTTLQITSCQLVLGRNMIHNIAFRANLNQIEKRYQDIIN